MLDWKLSDDARCEDLDMSDVFVLVLRKKIPLRLIPVMPTSYASYLIFESVL